MATRFSATAAAIGMAGGVLGASSAGAAATVPPASIASQPAGAAFPSPIPSPIPFSVADPATAPRPVITVAIGGVPLLLLLDTGSTGIRVAADKIPADAVRVTGAAAAYGYGSGIRLHGDQADADVVIGGGHTGPLPIELVRSTDCFPDKPDCPAAHGAKPAMFGGVLDGIMGVSPEEVSGLVNPLWALHDAAGRPVGRQFAVRYDPASASGEVLLDVPATGYGLVQLPRTPVTDSRHAGASSHYDARSAVSAYTSSSIGIYPGSYAARADRFSTLPDAAEPHRLGAPAFPTPPSWNPRAVLTCIEGPGLGKTCGPAMFDTGTPEFALTVPGSPAGTWPAGRSLVLGVPAAGWSATYRTGPGTSVTVAPTASTTAYGTLIGLPAFAKGPIRFDLAAGTVGFPMPASPKPAMAPAPAQAPTAPPAPAPAPAPAPKKQQPKLPFHMTGTKARSLPDTGVPMSAALGAVTALTALLAGIGTVLAARRRT